ncbi:MAG: NAD-dependent epimerase/dehydratase family protein [Chloroflexota bacterium]
MRALVIGGTGPTGPYIVEGLLKRGYDVTILHRGTHEVGLPREVEHIHGDPHFLETLEEALGPRKFDLVVFTYGRLRLVAQAMKGRTPRFIAAGGAAYKVRMLAEAGSLEGCPIPIPEDSPLQLDPNLNPGGFGKFYYMMAISELEVLKAHQEGHYNATYLRYPRLYGPRQLAPREWSMIRRFLDGRRQIIVPDNGLKADSRGYVENMAHALLLTVDKPDASAGKSYNVGDEKTFTLREWIVTIARAMNREVELVNIPYSVARPGHAYSWGRYFHEVRDITAIKKDVGYRDLVSAEEGIRRTVQWYLENRPEPGGELERQLADPFDYKAEDQLIAEFRECEKRLLQLPFAGYQRRHPYPHPKKPGES